MSLLVPPTDADLLPLLANGATTYASAGSQCALVVEDGVVRFHGGVSCAMVIYAGECAVAWSRAQRIDLSACDGIAVRARGDGRRYLLRIRTSECFADAAYQAEIVTQAGAWIDIELPFASFATVTRWRALPGHPPLDPALVKTIALNPYWQEGPFALEIGSLTATRSLQRTEPARGPSGDVWARWLDEVLFPLALQADGLRKETTPADVFARAEERRASARIPCYEESAEIRIEDLLGVRAALTAARHAGDLRSRRTSEAIVFLAMEAAYELAIAADLVAECGAVGEASDDFLVRETLAEDVFSRWQQLDGHVAWALREAGLVIELVQPTTA